jgi:threonylcarbamoyladenosine tRNA methylthiotransferase MtaB
MQSGSDSVLDRMKRHYNSSVYFEKVCLIREFYINPAITTDVIVGFPMETEEEATETFNFVKKVNFSNLHIFKYSIRKGTKAAEMKPQVGGLIKTKRSRELSGLGKQMHSTYLSEYINEKVDVLFEEDIVINNNTFKTGYTTNYMKVYIKTDESNGNVNVKDNNLLITGQIKEVVLIKLFKDGILGQMY